ncbi:MAG: sensor domain-containing diguanylate cyclase [Candidatus Omnitrophota bacterium]
MPQAVMSYEKQAPSMRRKEFLIIFITLALLPCLPFIKKGYIFLLALNFSLLSVAAAAFEFGYRFSYLISAALTAITFISLFFNPEFKLFYFMAIIFLNTIAFVPSYYNRLHNKYFFSKRTLFERSKAAFNDLAAELAGVNNQNAVLQSRIYDILDLYEVTKKMSAFLNMSEMLAVFASAVKKISVFDSAKVILVEDSARLPAALTTYEIKNPVSGEFKSSDIHLQSSGEFEEAVIEAMVVRKGVIYLEAPVEKTNPLWKYLDKETGAFSIFPLFSEETLIGVLMFSGTKDEEIESLLILAEQLALAVKRINLYEKVQSLAITDGLTGLYVRRHFLERLNEEIARSERHNLKLSVLMIDLDHFKLCNDTYGHLVGDIALKDIAKIMREHIRQVDLIGRYGGEEFIIALPDTDKSAAVSVADRIRQSTEIRKFRAYDETISMTVSIGVATYPADGLSAAALIDNADQVLYKAKKQGRNMVIG